MPRKTAASRAEYQREWRAQNIDKARGYKVKHLLAENRRRIERQYGIPKEDSLQVLERREAGGPCDLCGVIGPLQIDHSHERMVFRGLLCGLCNRGLGQFKDDPERLRAAITYLGGACA